MWGTAGSFCGGRRPVCSTMADDFLVLHVPTDYDSLIESVFKTELVVLLMEKSREFGSSIDLNFSDEYGGAARARARTRSAAVRTVEALTRVGRALAWAFGRALVIARLGSGGTAGSRT